MPIKFDGNIKFDLNIAINITVTILVLLTLNNSNQTHQDVQDVKSNVDDVKQNTKNVDTKVDSKFNTTIQRLNLQGNFSQLSEKQQLSLLNKIFNEVR